MDSPSDELMIGAGQQHLLSVIYTLLCLSSNWLQTHQDLSTLLSNHLANRRFYVNTTWLLLTPSLPLGPSTKIRTRLQASLMSIKKTCCFGPKWDLLMIGYMSEFYRTYGRECQLLVKWKYWVCYLSHALFVSLLDFLPLCNSAMGEDLDDSRLIGTWNSFSFG